MQLPGPHVVLVIQKPSLQVPVPQSMHVVPPVPQLRGRVPTRHTPAAPQQPAQLPGPHSVVDSHCPPTHCWPGLHIKHWLPPAPHNPGGGGAPFSPMHVFWKQQPLQFAGLHAIVAQV